MLCVTKIEATDVPDDWWKIDRMEDAIPVRMIPDDGTGPIAESFNVVRELVKGRRFRIPIDNGIDHGYREICIGWSEQVYEAIGIPLKVFENQERRLEECRIEVDKFENRCKTFSKIIGEMTERRKNMSFWNRLKYLFKRG